MRPYCKVVHSKDGRQNLSWSLTCNERGCGPRALKRTKTTIKVSQKCSI